MAELSEPIVLVWVTKGGPDELLMRERSWLRAGFALGPLVMLLYLDLER